MRIRFVANFVRLVILALTILASVYAQETAKQKPDFSGIWLEGDTTLKIKIEGPKLTIKRTSRTRDSYLVYGVWQHFTGADELVYYTDGRGETQKSWKAKSITKWEGDKLVVRISSYRNDEGDAVAIDVTHIWEMSKDGTELMLTRVFQSSGKTTTVHQLFAKKKS